MACYHDDSGAIEDAAGGFTDAEEAAWDLLGDVTGCWPEWDRRDEDDDAR
jgi:hypothetical protein